LQAAPTAGIHTLGRQTLVGRSPAFAQAVERARALTAHTAVFLSGEAGTGKELLARGLHYAGEGADHPFLSVNCAAIPDHLLGPELFGTHPEMVAGGRPARRGLLELAGAGTVFIDEVTRLPADVQARLLTATTEHTVLRVGGESPVHVGCRILFATTAAPAAALATGTLHPPLYERMADARVDVPPLREREGDIELLAQYFLHVLAGEHGWVRRLEPAAVEALESHPWPGNVRELRQVVERAASMAGPEVRPEHLIVQHRTSRSGASQGVPAAAEIHIPATGKRLEEIEAEAVALTLQLTRGNQSAAARTLGISRPTLARKLREHRNATGTPDAPDPL
jgi:DNA-binding NtrC family response regulator